MHNVILLITDTYRWDNLARRHADMPVRTPQLDRFAEAGAIEVQGFYTGSFPTIPHRTDIATGRIGWPHYGWQPIERSGRNHIGRILGAHGYASQLICDCPHLFPSRFDQGFEAACHIRGQEGDRPLLHLNDPIATVMPLDKTRTSPMIRDHPLVDVHRWTNRYWRGEAESFPCRTSETAVRWLEENSAAGPFFLWVDFFDPHEPWDAPEYLVRRYDPAYAGAPMMHPNYGPSSAYTAAELRNLRAHYAAESELVDRWVGRVLQKLDDLGMWENSVVVVTSDHGTSLGEHARTGKSNITDNDPRFWPLYPELGHVPFLISAPGLAKGRSMPLFAQPADFLPTVCDLAGVKAQPPDPFTGRSFANALRTGTGKHREFVVTGCWAGNGTNVPARSSTPFVVTEKWGYAPIGAAGAPELYDLTKDPLAAADVAAANPDVVREMHGLLTKHLRDNGAAEETITMWTSRAKSILGGSWARDYIS